ncbi:hypothetical protein HYT25_04355 [Candidatus Pacearchaeota archaeon]|nr:hypothetical protein [Candidatus Pacearchaeota archaeon]
MNHENLIHVKFEYAEALEGKKDMLNLERNFLRTSETIDRFNSLRSEEMKAKLRLQKKMKETAEILKNFKKMLPEAKMPHVKEEKIAKPVLEKSKQETSEKPKTIEKRAVETKVKTSRASNDLESQIREIQEKLNSLRD